MKTIIIYFSGKQKNTYKIIESINTSIDNIEVYPVSSAPTDLRSYDKICFASGIYKFKFAKPMLSFIESAKLSPNQEIFLLSTSNSGLSFFGNAKKILKGKNVNVIGGFTSKGYTERGKIKASKGHPTTQDKNNSVIAFKNFMSA